MFWGMAIWRKSLELIEKMRDEGASDHEIDVALAEAKPLGRAGGS